MGLSNYPPGVTGNEPEIAGSIHYPGPLPTAEAVDAVELPEHAIRDLATAISDMFEDDIEQIAMDLAGAVEGFDTDMIDYDDYIEGPHAHMVDRVLDRLMTYLKNEV